MEAENNGRKEAHDVNIQNKNPLFASPFASVNEEKFETIIVKK